MNRIKIKQKAKQIVIKHFKEIWPAISFILLLTILISMLEITIINKFQTCWYPITKELCILTSGELYANFLALLFSLITAFLSFGMTFILMAIVRKEKVEFNDIFKYKKQFLKLFLITTLVNLMINLGNLFIIGGIILVMDYAFIKQVYVDNCQLNALQIMKKSRELIRGYKFDYFIFNCSFIGWILFSWVTLGIGLIWTFPYLLISQVLYYSELKKIKM